MNGNDRLNVGVTVLALLGLAAGAVWLAWWAAATIWGILR